MKYGKHTFEPAGKLDQKKCKSIANIMLKSHNTNIKMWDDNFTKAYGEKPEKDIVTRNFIKQWAMLMRIFSYATMENNIFLANMS